MPEARRHHYVSQFYLKNFTADRSKPRLFVVDLREHKSYPMKPQNVAFERDFHTISIPGQRSDVVETALAKVEHEVAPALARIIANASLKSEDALPLIFFVTMLFVKNPRKRDVHNALAHKFVTSIGKSQASDPEVFTAIVQRQIADGDMPPGTNIEELRQSILSDSYTLSLATEAHLDIEFSSIPDLMPYVSGRRWVLYRASEGQFITCDNPVVLTWADPTRNAPIGLGLAETRLLFPLSSEFAVCGGFELEEDVIDLGAHDVAMINGCLVANANRQVYARDDGFEYILPRNSATRYGRELKTEQQIPDRTALVIYDGSSSERI